MITDGMYVVAEYTGTQNTYYYRGMNLIGYVANDEIGYYRFNAHGDVVAVVDTAGEIITEYSYDPFGKLEDDENEWLKILFGIYVEDNNPFRYCAEYYDTETEFIYLRARYYSPDLQRFISEDPIRFKNNWYAYCDNMPIVYTDVSGLYYIKESYTVEYDMFGHSRRVSTGVYTLCPETWWSYTGKAIVGFLPFGTGITWLFESSENVVGGNSSTSFNDVVTDSVTELAVELTTAALKEVSESISGIIGVASTLLQIVDVIKKLDMVQMDAIAFDLLTRNNISLSSTSQEELEQLMEKTYEFILVNGDYFALKIDGNRTLYEIDQKISKAWFKDWCIDSLVQDVKNDIDDLVYNGGQYDLAQKREEILSAYRELYGDYSNRIEYVDEVFLKYISM